MSVFARVFGGIALICLTFVGIGVLLPGEWSASASRHLEVAPDSAFSVLSRVGAWHQWMPWPDTGARPTGPASGPGASIAWDDPVYGRGEVRIVDTDPPRRLEYRVSVEDDAIVVLGTVEIRPEDGGSEVRWTESARAGPNPLLGFAALTQDERQAEQLREALERLASYLEGTPRSVDGG